MKIQKILLQEMEVPLSLGHVLCSEASLAYMPPILEALEEKSSYGDLLGYGSGPIRSSGHQCLVLINCLIIFGT